jgi:hypothetical protein
MNAPHPRHRTDHDQPNVVVEADPDPNAARAEQLDRANAEKAEFAKAEAEFAKKEFEHGEHLVSEGKEQEGTAYEHDATSHMQDARHIMDDASSGDREVDRMRETRRKELSLMVAAMPDQTLFTLRDAVSSVRSYVENMTELDTRMLTLAMRLSDEVVEQQRLIVIATGQNIEFTLNSIEQSRRDAPGLVRDLVTFMTITIEFATHLPQLMALVNEFGRLLLQFHL